MCQWNMIAVLKPNLKAFHCEEGFNNKGHAVGMVGNAVL